MVSRRARRLAAAACTAALVAVSLATGAGPGQAGIRSEVIQRPQAKASDYDLRQRETAAPVTSARFHAALAAAARMRAEAVEAGSPWTAPTWESMGPSNIGGRVVDVAVDPTTPGVVYAATASGGVWKSTDNGDTFAPAWPLDEVQSIGAIAIAPDGTVYVGTGEGAPGGGSLTYPGRGIFRSRDGGATWEHLGLTDSWAFGRVAIDPTDPSRIWAAAVGPLTHGGGERGLYVTEDGGDTWQLALAGANAFTGAIDVAVDPSDPDRVLVAMWERYRARNIRRYAGPGSGLFLTTDGGATWTRPSVDPFGFGPSVSRIGIAYSPSDPSTAYAIVGTGSGTLQGMWRSRDHGSTWQGLPRDLVLETSQGGQSWWAGRVWVDPLSSERVFVAGIDLVESVNGGQTFTPHTVALASVVVPTMLHVDQHAMAFDPHSNAVFLGNDGGMYRSDARGATGTWVGARFQGWTQHYSVDVSEQFPDRVVSGLQDNRCIRNHPPFGPGSASAWVNYSLCGDGLATLIDPSDATILYGCSQFGSCSRIDDDNPANVTTFSPSGSRRGWFTPVVFDPDDPSRLYGGTERVSVSANRGSSWTVISPDLSSAPPNTSNYPYGTVTSIATAPGTDDVIWAGTDDGRLWRTTDAGASWTRIQHPELSSAWVTSIAVDHADPARVAVTYSGYLLDDRAAHVVLTTDGGATWSAIGTGLPDAPVMQARFIDDRIVVGGDVGVFITDDDGTSWHPLGAGMPAVPVNWLRYHAGTDTLTIATYGRGVMRLAMPA